MENLTEDNKVQLAGLLYFLRFSNEMDKAVNLLSGDPGDNPLYITHQLIYSLLHLDYSDESLIDQFELLNDIIEDCLLMLAPKDEVPHTNELLVQSASRSIEKLMKAVNVIFLSVRKSMTEPVVFIDAVQDLVKETTYLS